MLITFLILIVTIALFIHGRLRADFVALLSMMALFLAGILTTPQALAGFSDSTVILIAALFVVSEGLDASGVTAWAGQRLIAVAGTNKTRLLVLTIALVALLTALISVNGAVAALLPVSIPQDTARPSARSRSPSL